jgi:hypothetical protein
MPEPSELRQLLLAPCDEPKIRDLGPIADTHQDLLHGHNWGITSVTPWPLTTNLADPMNRASGQVRPSMAPRVTSCLKTRKLVQILSPRLTFSQVKGPLPSPGEGPSPCLSDFLGDYGFSFPVPKRLSIATAPVWRTGRIWWR